MVGLGLKKGKNGNQRHRNRSICGIFRRTFKKLQFALPVCYKKIQWAGDKFGKMA